MFRAAMQFFSYLLLRNKFFHYGAHCMLLFHRFDHGLLLSMLLLHPRNAINGFASSMHMAVIRRLTQVQFALADRAFDDLSAVCQRLWLDSPLASNLESRHCSIQCRVRFLLILLNFLISRLKEEGARNHLFAAPINLFSNRGLAGLDVCPSFIGGQRVVLHAWKAQHDARLVDVKRFRVIHAYLAA